MAKGDRGDVNNAIQQYGNVPFSQSQSMMPQYQGMYNNMANNYQNTWNQGMGNYNNIMSGYQNFLGGGAMGPGSNYGSGMTGGYNPPSAGVDWRNANPGGQRYYITDPNSGRSIDQSPGGGGGSSSSGGGGGNPDAFGQAWVASGGRTVQDLKNFVAAHPEYGATLGGSKGDKVTIGGRTFDAVIGAGAGGQGASWNDITAGGGGGGGYPGAIGSALAGYGDFALTGGFSPQDIQDIRARNTAASRAAFQQGQDDLSRQRALAGQGGMPNFAAAQAKMSREQGQQASDIQTATNAQIAQMVQQGKLAGLGGLSQTGLLGQGQNLAALQGMTGLYGTAPGPAGQAQSGMLGASGQQLNLQQLINSMGLGLIGSRIGATQVPSNWQQFLGTWGPIISGAAGAFF